MQSFLRGSQSKTRGISQHVDAIIWSELLSIQKVPGCLKMVRVQLKNGVVDNVFKLDVQ